MNTLIILSAQYLYAVVVVTSLGWASARRGEPRRLYFIHLALAGVLAILCTQLGGALYQHPRPFIALHFQPLLPHVADNSFPSDHTIVSMLFALLTWRVSRPISCILIVLAVLVGLARVACGLHWPVDIVGAIIIAVASAGLAAAAVPSVSGHISRPGRRDA